MPFEINGDTIRTIATVCSLAIALASLAIAYLNRRELRRAHLVVNVFPVDGKVCISLSNAGQRLAYNVQLVIDGTLKSRLSNIHCIAPDATYRAPLLQRKDIKRLDSEKLIVRATYNDCLHRDEGNPVVIGPLVFDLDEMLSYDIEYKGSEKTFVVWPSSD